MLITSKTTKITNLVEDNTEEEEDNVEDLVDNHLSKWYMTEMRYIWWLSVFFLINYFRSGSQNIHLLSIQNKDTTYSTLIK